MAYQLPNWENKFSPTWRKIANAYCLAEDEEQWIWFCKIAKVVSWSPNVKHLQEAQRGVDWAFNKRYINYYQWNWWSREIEHEITEHSQNRRKKTKEIS